MATLLGATWGLARIWPEQGLRNPCRSDLPRHIAEHEVVQAAWAGLDPARVWDAHAHLVGTGDSASGIYISPELRKPLNPLHYARFLFYLNAGCVHDEPGRVDASFVARLLNLAEGMRPGFKVMLFAFDAVVGIDGNVQLDQTIFHVPDEYAAQVAHQHPVHFEWVASIHPYRGDATERVARAVALGARAVKWLPNAMLIDPAAPRCDPFYETLARFDLPLITHVGHEAAVPSAEGQNLGNPLRLRRALEHGVRVIAAHCASLGTDVDLDRGENGPRLESFALFERLMSEGRYQNLLFGDVSAITLRNRLGSPLKHILARRDWHARLLNGSDYPLPGIFPIISLRTLVDQGFISQDVVGVLQELRAHNPLLFDFVLKRNLRWEGNALPPGVFETKRHFVRAD